MSQSTDDSFTVPWTVAEELSVAHARQARRRVRPTTTATAGRVLLADDDGEMRKVLALVLRAKGFTVVEVKSGVELLEYLEPCIFERQPEGDTEDYDLVVSDVRMPGLTGIEVLRGLRALRAHGRRIPFLLITAFGDHEIHAQAEELGAVAVLDKPFEMSDFLRVVRQALSSDGPPDSPADSDP